MTLATEKVLARVSRLVMLRIWLVLLALVFVAPIVGSAAPTPAPHASPAAKAKAKAKPSKAKVSLKDSAPADEYFGAFKMSPLGIRLQIGILERNFGWRTMTDDQIIHDADLVEEALHAWQKKYPLDPWLPSASYHLEQLYELVQTENARTRATRTLHYIVQYWPKTKQGSLSKQQLAKGFPPLHEEPPMRATPTPVPTVSPAPSPSPEPTATPTATPSPSPTAAPRRGRRAPKATPSPSPSPKPSPSPEPSPTSS